MNTTPDWNCLTCGHSDLDHEHVREDTYGNEIQFLGSCNIEDCECEEYEWEEN